MKPKAIVIDLDGTLLNSDKSISAKSIEVLTRIKKTGIRLVFATARPPRSINYDKCDIKEMGSMVYYNGAYIDCNITGISCHLGIDPKLGSEVIDYISQLDEEAEVSVEIQDNWFSHKKLDYKVSEVMRTDHNPKFLDLESIKSRELTKILLTSFNYSEKLIERYKDELNIIQTDNRQIIQVMAKGVNKAMAVKMITEKLGIEMDEVVCFGDDYNDLDLFEACGYSVAMENGISALKQLASEVTKSNDEDGVGIVLERLLVNGIL